LRERWGRKWGEDGNKVESGCRMWLKMRWRERG